MSASWLVRSLGACALVLALAASCARSSPIASSPSSPSLKDERSSTHDCAGCHVREAAEWRESIHRSAFTNTFYRASYDDERLAFCVRCHAPHATSRDGDPYQAIFDRERAAVERGVDCIDCHGSEAPKVVRSRGSRAPHAVTVDPTLGTASCGGCHEFSQPNANEALQTTMTEHTRSDFASASCSDCHMGGTSGRIDHRFLAGVRNVERMRASLKVSVVRTAARTIRIAIETVGVGHALPTGDLFRRLRLDIDALDTEGRIDDQTSVFFGRTFAIRGNVRANLQDRRIEGKRTEEHGIPFELGESARFRLHYERGLAERGGRATIGDSTLLFEGKIP